MICILLCCLLWFLMQIPCGGCKHRNPASSLIVIAPLYCLNIWLQQVCILGWNYHPSVLVHCSLWPSFTPIHTNVMLKQTSRRSPVHTVAQVVDWVTLSNDMYSTMLSSLIPNADPLWRLQTQESSLITNSYCSFVLLKHLITTSVHSRLELPS
jgi:hypothetical protein